MRKIYRSILISLLLATLVFSGVQADDPIIATHDVTCSINSPGLNLNGGALRVSYTNNYAAGVVVSQASYLRFNLTGLSGPVGSNAVVRLYMLRGASYAFDVSIWSIEDDSWTETTLMAVDPPGSPPPYCPPLNVVKLDTRQTVATGQTLDFSSPALTAFLNNQVLGDDNASFLVTFENLPADSRPPNDYIIMGEKERYPDQAPTLLPESPTAVDVSTMSTEATPGRISLNWEVINDSGMTGFNVLRGTSPDAAAATLLNSTPILVQPGSSPGQMYYLVDGSVTPGVEYYYWLQVLYLNYDRLNGPVIATPPYGIYLPMVSQ